MDFKRFAPGVEPRSRAMRLRVKMYEGTKHTFATDAYERGVDLYRLRDFLGHTEHRSTVRYAKLAEVGRIEVLRPPSDLSLAGIER